MAHGTQGKRTRVRKIMYDADGRLRKGGEHNKYWCCYARGGSHDGPSAAISPTSDIAIVGDRLLQL